MRSSSMPLLDSSRVCPCAAPDASNKAAHTQAARFKGRRWMRAESFIDRLPRQGADVGPHGGLENASWLFVRRREGVSPDGSFQESVRGRSDTGQAVKFKLQHDAGVAIAGAVAHVAPSDQSQAPAAGTV